MFILNCFSVYLLFKFDFRYCFISDTARYYLKLSEQDVEKAINLYYQDKLEISKNQATSQSK